MAEQTSLISSDKENVVIQAGSCSVTVLPQFGGKVASIQFNGHELLQPPLAYVEPRTRTMSFDAGDASGWDECLPSVAACTVPTANGPADIPDHGDLWRVPWLDISPDGDATSIHLRAACFSLPLELERKLSLHETATGFRLSVDYKLTNAGHIPAPWSWAAHPLFLAAAGDRIILPPSIKLLRVEGSGGNRLGRTGDTVSWPIAALAAGGKDDLSVAQAPDSAIGDKLFAGPLAPHENWCALERPSAGVRIRFGFDPIQNPYLGLWICYGGWPDRPGPKQTCVALEPATAPVDSLAQPGPWSRVLEPGKSEVWAMHIDLDSLQFGAV
jgi:galactose mutarotase-like enzyme